MDKQVLGAGGGSLLSAIGTVAQTNEVLQMISLTITIIGALITIAMAISNWWKKAKEDGKIDNKEIKELKDIISEGKNTIESIMEDNNGKDSKSNK